MSAKPAACRKAQQTAVDRTVLPLADVAPWALQELRFLSQAKKAWVIQAQTRTCAAPCAKVR